MANAVQIDRTEIDKVKHDVFSALEQDDHVDDDLDALGLPDADSRQPQDLPPHRLQRKFRDKCRTGVQCTIGVLLCGGGCCCCACAFAAIAQDLCPRLTSVNAGCPSPYRDYAANAWRVKVPFTDHFLLAPTFLSLVVFGLLSVIYYFIAVA